MNKQQLKTFAARVGIKNLGRVLRQVRLLLEHGLYGGRIREAICVELLRGYYQSRFRRLWILSDEPPHFTYHRGGAFDLAYGDRRNPYALYRGFLHLEVIREGDRLLDVGCGDGYFAKTFFASKCGQVDAIDIDPSAIAVAQTENGGSNISYGVCDAILQPFPSRRYDVVVWDGAIGHFPQTATDLMLAKIKASLAKGGIFAGSESLGEEGHDHLHYFYTLQDLAALFRPHFRYVRLKTAQYLIGGGYLRREAYWRCCDDNDRLLGSSWEELE
jgi:SAM-dependent methyltransferase